MEIRVINFSNKALLCYDNGKYITTINKQGVGRQTEDSSYALASWGHYPIEDYLRPECQLSSLEVVKHVRLWYKANINNLKD